MIIEDYVSFEVAKRLKEKGFDESTELCFVGEEWESPSPLTNSQLPDGRYSRPTLQMAMKWLREVHKIHIMVDCIGSENYIPTIQFTHNSKDIILEGKKSKIGGNGFDSYEEACETAIKYCLEKLV